MNPPTRQNTTKGFKGTMKPRRMRTSSAHKQQLSEVIFLEEEQQIHSEETAAERNSETGVHTYLCVQLKKVHDGISRVLSELK